MQTCCKFIVPPVDDNVRLSVAQYRKLINQDIERMYPEQNSPTPKQSRSSHSFTKPKLEEAKPERRQRSLIQHKASSPIKPRESSLAKPCLEPAKPEVLEGLRRKGSRKQLVRKTKSRPCFKK